MYILTVKSKKPKKEDLTDPNEHHKVDIVCTYIHAYVCT